MDLVFESPLKVLNAKFPKIIRPNVSIRMQVNAIQSLVWYNMQNVKISEKVKKATTYLVIKIWALGILVKKNATKFGFTTLTSYVGDKINFVTRRLSPKMLKYMIKPNKVTCAAKRSKCKNLPEGELGTKVNGDPVGDGPGYSCVCKGSFQYIDGEGCTCAGDG